MTEFIIHKPASGPDTAPMFKTLLLAATVVHFSAVPEAQAAEPLFTGANLDAFECRPGSWVIEDGALTCRMEDVKDRKGNVRKRGMGYIWTREEYSDFVLTLTYRLSEAANSGVFFRTDKDNPVQGGFEIQLLDNAGYARKRGAAISPKNSNGALYDAVAPTAGPGKPAGQWNTFRLTCKGSKIRVEINGIQTVEADIDQWKHAGRNPDGSKNKFKTALKDLPRTGRIGFQNHGQVVWIRDVEIRRL
jgi:hypothetical protein